MTNPTPPLSTIERAVRVSQTGLGRHTLTPWIRKIEAEFTRSVFSEATRASHELELDLSGFLRGDPETRWASHEIAVKNHILTPNEVRVVEGWNPREGGDDFPQEATGG